MAHAVVRFEEKNLSVPDGYGPHSKGYSRVSLIDHRTTEAAVHMAHQIVQLEPGGYLEQNVLAYEKSLYVLEGELDLMLEGRAYRMGQGDYALVLVGTPHAMRSSSGNGARWMEMIAPQPLARSVGQDTFSWANLIGRPGSSVSIKATLARVSLDTSKMRSFPRRATCKWTAIAVMGRD